MGLPLETEILTKSGWVTYNQVRVGGPALTYNVERHLTEWQVVEGVELSDFDGELLSIENRWGHKYRWTRDHQLPVYEQYGHKRKIVNASDLKSHHRILLVAPHVFGEVSLLSEREAALLGWIVTDGYHRWRGNHFESMVYQSEGKHAQKIRAEFDWAIMSESIHPGTGVRCFRLSAQSTRKICALFHSKMDLPTLAVHLSRACVEAMYGTMMDAEGTDRPECTQFPQNDGPVLDAFQIICYLLGKASHIRPRKGCGGSCVYVKHRDKISLFKWDRGVEPYQGRVWRPVTANQTWVIRQNGCVII